MTGWRIGYIVASKQLVDNITKLNQITINNVPVFIQEAALKGSGNGKTTCHNNKRRISRTSKNGN